MQRIAVCFTVEPPSLSSPNVSQATGNKCVGCTLLGSICEIVGVDATSLADNRCCHRHMKGASIYEHPQFGFDWFCSVLVPVTACAIL